jgi:hypothetical protein
MQKILASLLAAVTVAGSLVIAPPVDARQRGIWRYGNGIHAYGGQRYYAYPRAYRARHYGWYNGRNRWYGRQYGWRGYGWRPYRYGYYGYGNYGYDNGGNAVAAGIVGLAAGMMIGSALNQRHYSSGPGYCEARFRSYNRATGTYLGYDGFWHPCP